MQLPNVNSGMLNPYFLGAPLSKAFSILSVAAFVSCEMFELHTSLDLDFDRIFAFGEIWRFFTCQISFETLGELLFSLGILCPLLRRFEREMSSKKFGTFLFFSVVISSIWETILFYNFSSSEGNTARASGPYSVLGSIIYLYHMYTPRMYPKFFGMLGFHFSEKAFTYAIAFQLCFSAGLATLLPILSGMAAGFVCLHRGLPIQEWELPNWIYNAFHRFGQIFVDVPMQTHNMHPRRRNAQNIMHNNIRQRLVAENHNRAQFPLLPTRPAAPAPQPTLMTPPPSEEIVETLTSMGFEREAVLRVLQQCDNNVEVAANRLLNA